MKIVQGLTDNPNQQTSLALPDGSRATLVLNFRPQQLAWYFDLVWTRVDGTTLPIRGLKLVASPNMLRQYRKRLPFGLGLITLNDIEPTTQSTFIDGTSQMLLLDAVDVSNIEQRVFPGL